MIGLLLCRLGLHEDSPDCHRCGRRRRGDHFDPYRSWERARRKRRRRRA